MEMEEDVGKQRGKKKQSERVRRVQRKGNTTPSSAASSGTKQTERGKKRQFSTPRNILPKVTLKTGARRYRALSGSGSTFELPPDYPKQVTVKKPQIPPESAPPSADMDNEVEWEEEIVEELIEQIEDDLPRINTSFTQEPGFTVPEYAENMACRSHDDCQVSVTTVDRYRFCICKLQLTHASGLLRREIDQYIARGEAGNQIMLPVHGQTFYDWLCCCTVNTKCEWAEAEPHPFPSEAGRLLPLVRLALALEGRSSLIDQLSAAVAQLQCEWEQKLPLMEMVITKPDTNTRLLNAVVHLVAQERDLGMLNKLNEWSPAFSHMVLQRRGELNKHQGHATIDQFQVNERLFAMLYHQNVDQ